MTVISERWRLKLSMPSNRATHAGSQEPSSGYRFGGHDVCKNWCCGRCLRIDNKLFGLVRAFLHLHDIFGQNALDVLAGQPRTNAYKSQFNMKFQQNLIHHFKKSLNDMDNMGVSSTGRSSLILSKTLHAQLRRNMNQKNYTWVVRLEGYRILPVTKQHKIYANDHLASISISLMVLDRGASDVKASSFCLSPNSYKCHNTTSQLF